MNLPYFIAKRLSTDHSSGSSGLIIRIAITSVAISVAVMICAIAIVKGYQLEIRNKITGFGSHIQISSLDLNNSYETNPVAADPVMERMITGNEEVSGIQKVAFKAGIIKTKDEFQGIVLKGVDSAYSWDFIRQYLIEGDIPLMTDTIPATGILLSRTNADKLHLKVGDKVVVYFAQDPPRGRPFKLTGIYKTGFEDLDDLYAFIDMRHIRKVSGWDENYISGYEIRVRDFAKLNAVAGELTAYIPYNMEINTVEQLQPQIFEWLGFLDINVLIIIVLMVIVACINMATALLILIVERSNMIGILKALGAPDRAISRTFLYMASYLVLIGLLIGNLAGIVLCWSQQKYGWFKLSQEAYYLSEVPIRLNFMDITLLNIGSFVVCYLILLLPSAFVSRITPVKAIRFE